MIEELELRLVNIQWNSADRFAYLNEISKNPIRITKQKTKQFIAEIPSYPTFENNLPCQFALQCKSTIIKETPKVKRENDVVNLFPILDSKYGKWWIEKGNWDRNKKYHDSPSCRHAGNYTILIGETSLHLNIIPSGFTPVEYHDLLSSFKGELWQLILDKDSTTTISKDGEGKLPGVKFQRQVSKFIKFAEQILAKPTEELRECQEVQRIEKARPNFRTFMELSTKGQAVKFVTGRGSEPSYNTPENRYIADIINRLVLIVLNLKNGTKYSKDALNRSIENIKKYLSHTQNNVVKINQDKLNAEIEQEERKRQYWEQKRIHFEKYYSNIDVNKKVYIYQESIIFTVENCAIKEDYPDFIDIRIKHKNSALIKIPSESCDITFFSKNVKYEISEVFYKASEFPYEDTIDNSKKTLYIATIKTLSRIRILEDPHEHVISLLKEKRHNYSKNNWQRPLRNNEKKQKEIEQLGIQKRQEMLTNTADKYEKRLNTLNSIYKELLALHKKCEKLKIRNENRLDYPGTMTFVQNPSYRGAYSTYKAIKNDVKFENLFDDLLVIQEFGITDQPNIYEKWCLLQITNILEEYGFTQIKGWEAKLISLISRNSYATCSFSFVHSSLDQKVELIYQPKMANFRTPDFMLKITSTTGVTKLILDAKNKNYNQVLSQHNTFSEDLKNLVSVNGKNYSNSGNNAVFILHPMNKKGFLPVLPTPQSWSSCTTLGGSSIFDWEENKNFGPEHMYGGAQLRPEALNSLKLVIALSLQYLTEDNHKVYSKEEPSNTDFCIVCGGIDFSMRQRCNTKGVHYSCKNCHHFFVRHYCGCGTRLWKHGSYWTYHDTRSTEPYNIKCPDCGDSYIEEER